MNQPFRRGNWLLTIPLVAVGIGYLYFFFLPAKEEISRLRAELKNRQSEITQAQPLKVALFQKEEESQSTNEFISQWMGGNESDAASVLADISRHVYASGVQTMRFDPQPTAKLQTVKRTPLVLGTTGTFAQHFDMLHRLESLPATIWIEQLNLRSPTKEGEQLESELSLAIFAVNRDISD